MERYTKPWPILCLGIFGLACLFPTSFFRAPAAMNGRSSNLSRPGISLPPENGSVYQVLAFGAKGDGKTLDSPAVNKAIEAAASAGGGTVFFPAGTYLCLSIHLKSNIALYLDRGCTIIAADSSSDGDRYDPPEQNQWDMYQDFGHSHFHNSLIWGEQLEDVSILGPGGIWGRGLSSSDHVPEGGGNKSISLKLCRNVLIRDLTILHGGHFGILATGVDLLTIDNLKIDTNRDGIDIDCCRNVRVSNCGINSPIDDGLCLKSSYPLGFPRATENVTITNCQVSGYDEGTFLDGTYKRERKGQHYTPTGRIKFGTESNGGFKNITISNCVFDYCRGLALETVDGGLLEDVVISNITMRDVTSAPIFLRLGNRARGPKETTPVGRLRRILISNVIVYNADARWSSIISGIPGHEIEDVRLSNIHIYYPGGGTAAQAALEPPEKETAYPEPTMFGETPAYGFFIRHVKGLEMSDVEVSCAKPDLRPAFVLQDVTGADFQHVRSEASSGVPTFVLKEVSDFSTSQCRPVPDKRI
ncbi:MAG TPA: glycoside hydrolase family 28 protein, partial [Blastocatellia bacterium]|nr:glycoside hydrolase family 28 protein [Blastocatellia bacterium]